MAKRLSAMCIVLTIMMGSQTKIVRRKNENLPGKRSNALLLEVHIAHEYSSSLAGIADIIFSRLSTQYKIVAVQIEVSQRFNDIAIIMLNEVQKTLAKTLRRYILHFSSNDLPAEEGCIQLISTLDLEKKVEFHLEFIGSEFTLQNRSLVDCILSQMKPSLVRYTSLYNRIGVITIGLKIMDKNYLILNEENKFTMRKFDYFCIKNFGKHLSLNGKQFVHSSELVRYNRVRTSLCSISVEFRYMIKVLPRKFEMCRIRFWYGSEILGNLKKLLYANLFINKGENVNFPNLEMFDDHGKKLLLAFQYPKKHYYITSRQSLKLMFLYYNQICLLDD